ncbi:hypothetical protein Glove_180g112 [Diversispora epigaea]|uniref:phosphatidate phosphatase n=1 Tax=Diversispora epigaea TaxID=1348612 RepID=A0A397IRI5_9GLOM|nr:hypothetical protein Glove_180g112 [Diversispora epigaea]
MNSVFKFVSTVNKFYSEINPATLSGAIDVIVVQQPDGELACSPFHVRFGKLSVLRPQEKKVEMTVNGKVVDFPMKIGEAGEAFFIFETDKTVPEELQTSPLAGPSDPSPDVEEPDFLDLGESNGTTLPISNETNEKNETSETTDINETSETNEKNDIDETNDINGTTETNEANEANDTNEINKLNETNETNEANEANTEIIETNNTNETNNLINVPVHENTVNYDNNMEDGYEGDTEPKALVLEREKKAELGVIIQELKDLNISNSLTSDEEMEIANTLLKDDFNVVMKDFTKVRDDKNLDPILNQDLNLESDDGSETVFTSSDQADMKLSDDGEKYEDLNIKDTVNKNKLFTSTNSHLIQLDEIIPQPNDENGESRNLDSENTRLNCERALAISSVHQNWGKSEGPFSDTELDETRKPEKPLERRIHKISPLSDTELDETRKPEKPLERRMHKISPLSDTELEYEPTKPEKSNNEWSWRWGALPVRTSEKIEHWQEGSSDNGWKDQEDLSGVEIGGKNYHFEISLCGNSGFGRDEKMDTELFRKKLVSYEQFSENPQLLNDKSLVFKYDNRYFTGPEILPLITSLLVFKKPLPEKVTTSLSNNRLEDLRSSDRRYSLRNWSRWWSRSASSQHTDNEAKTKDDKTKNNNTEETVSSQDTEQTTKFYAKTLRLTSDQLKSINLQKGVNTMSFSVPSSYQGKAICVAKLFFWDLNTHIVISDIDGTITKSDALGHVFTMIGKDWTHSGVAKLYTDIRNNGYEILYLTSRAIGQASYTRDYLEKVKQDKYQLPDGPVIMSPDRLLTAFHREVIMRKPEVFKMSCLRDVQKLFKDRNPFFAGFGNRITDALSYRSVNVPSSRIFTIDSNGEVKLQLLSGYKSSYIDLSDLVDQMFPHTGSKWDTVYNDFNYWKPEMLEIELPPEIYDSLKASKKPQKVPTITIDSPKRGMIQKLISGGSNEQTPTNSAPTSSSSSLKSYDNSSNKGLNGKRKQHMFYVGGDVDMPGRMDILPKSNGGGTMIGYYENDEDGDDEYLTDDQEEDFEEDFEGDFEEDVPAEIDLSNIPY